MLAALAALALGAPASAATANGAAQARVLKPVVLTKLRDIDFGRMISGTAAGTATINPTTGTRTLAGGVVTGGGTHSAGQFRITASANTLVLVSRGAFPVLTNGSGGTMTMSDMTMNGTSNPVLVVTGSLDIEIGGTLVIGANQAAGAYSGNFLLIANYL